MSFFGYPPLAGVALHLRWGLLAFGLCLTPGAVLANGLPPTLAAALAAARIPDSHVGILVQDLDASSPVLGLGETRSLNPASVMKLVTTLAALDGLGPAYTWKTRVWVDGEVRDGVLYGDLILQGGGDPALTQERFWRLLRETRELGVREIRGEVVIDNGLYGIDPPDPAAFDAAPLKPYNAAPTALLVNWNVMSLRLHPEGGGVAARLDPPALPLENQVLLDGLVPCNGWQEGLDFSRQGDVLYLAGRYPALCGGKTLHLNLMCPPATAATFFKALWRELGGGPVGQVRVGGVPETARLWLEQDSPPLSELVRDINKHSNNVMAKMLFLNLGLARYGGVATWEKGERAVREWLREKGLDLPELVLENGSGLSRIERISAASLAKLLAWAARQPLYYEFAASLPALGLEGTQKKRLNGSPLAGRGWLKTGSLDRVRALAGYVLDPAGRRKVLVFLVNHQNAEQVGRAQQALLEWAMGADVPLAQLPTP